MLPPFFSKPLSALLLFLFLFIPQSFARDDRNNENYMDKFISLLSGEIETSSSNKKSFEIIKKNNTRILLPRPRSRNRTDKNRNVCSKIGTGGGETNQQIPDRPQSESAH